MEEWDSLLWIRCTLSGRRIHSMRGAMKAARPDSKELKFVDVLPKLDV